ncbi:MAG: hypothetical protein KY450_14700 [Actinobacteria bacterium]|nr:hypothetical protein [Actinomycetota bacterium]
MSAASAQLGFAAEFVLFLVAVAGVGVVLRAQLLGSCRQDRMLLAAGFAGVGLASFLHGSLLVADAGASAVAVPRLLGIALLAAGSLRGDGVAPRRQLWLGLGLLTVAEAITLWPTLADLGVVANGARVLGTLGLGAALSTASQRSISARVAVAATGPAPAPRRPQPTGAMTSRSSPWSTTSSSRSTGTSAQHACRSTSTPTRRTTCR